MATQLDIVVLEDFAHVFAQHGALTNHGDGKETVAIRPTCRDDRLVEIVWPSLLSLVAAREAAKLETLLAGFGIVAIKVGGFGPDAVSVDVECGALGYNVCIGILSRSLV